jgi:uncharacterized protein (DUF849 family)
MGGDENSTKDGAAYVRAIEAIRQATEATLWIVAHTGHSEEAQDRPRGSSALPGAYDTSATRKKTKLTAALKSRSTATDSAEMRFPSPSNYTTRAR